jgi:hypothetical protein
MKMGASVGGPVRIGAEANEEAAFAGGRVIAEAEWLSAVDLVSDGQCVMVAG